MKSKPSSSLFRLAGFGLAALAACAGAALLHGAPVRLLPIGDSITQGNPNYRPYLDTLLQKAGYEFLYVGTEGHSPYFHNAYWGWETERVLALMDTIAKKTRPDIVLYHLGTNDILHEKDPIDSIVARTLREMDSIAVSLRRVNPKVTFYIAQLIPGGSAYDKGRLLKLNQAIAKLPATLGTAASPVFVVDQWGAVLHPQDFRDGLHPNESGARKMAQRWVEALLKAAPSTAMALPKGRQETRGNAEANSNRKARLPLSADGGITGAGAVFSFQALGIGPSGRKDASPFP